LESQVPLRIRGKMAGSSHPVEIVVDSGRIQTIGSPSFPGPGIGGENSWVAPAFFDVQVNGFAGVDFNSPGLTDELMNRVIERLREKGVVFFCPTVITHSFDHLAMCLRALSEACKAAVVANAIAAIHLEGPYLSHEDGPRGAHPLEHIREASWDEFQRLQDCAEGRIGMVTLAPEVPGALGLTQRLVESGVVVAIGHTAAAPETIRQAVQAGAKISTHLGNGSHTRIPRHRNYIWEQLACDELWASFIVDGHHLPPSVVKCMIRAKGCHHSILTSDAISAAGMPPGLYQLGSARVVVHPNLYVERADSVGSGILAGSALDLLRGVENVIRFAGVSQEEAILMASENPARLMGLEQRLGTIEPGREANLILFRVEGSSIHLECTVQGGDVVYKNPDC